MTTLTRFKILQSRAVRLANEARELWDKACQYDNTNPFSTFVVFSTRNPHIPRHGRVTAITEKAIRAARAMHARIPVNKEKPTNRISLN